MYISKEMTLCTKLTHCYCYCCCLHLNDFGMVFNDANINKCYFNRFSRFTKNIVCGDGECFHLFTNQKSNINDTNALHTDFFSIFFSLSKIEEMIMVWNMKIKTKTKWEFHDDNNNNEY